MTTVKNFPSISNLLKCTMVDQPDCYKLNGCYFNHIRELLDYNNGELNHFYVGGLRVKTLAHHAYDSRRFWDLSFVYYKDVPIMLIQNAGREGDDHAIRYIFNLEKYKECIEDLSVIKDDLDTFAGFDEETGLFINQEYDYTHTVLVTDIEECKSEYIDFYGNNIFNDNGCDFVDVEFEDFEVYHG